ncbi:MAG: molybdopterin-dependent oxidoreductase [Rhodobacteraceae bacterium]|jgi:CO/xanthine dehydrogenase Mo-binding subunit/CO/xanthine dehydrogenase FAD-binding subunit|nr:molybdopterin-dependent oxidoreductase [Paracoccaceae bacterium]
MSYPRIRHPEWAERTGGTLRYARDLFPEGLLVGKVLRCPHPAARIAALDLAEARRAPGVAAVLAAADLPDRAYRDYGQLDRPALAGGCAVWFGQEVAVLAAATEEAAAAALDLVRVEWDPLPHAASVPEALSPGAPAVHPQRAPDNVATRTDRRFGDPAAARAAAGRVRRARYGCGPQHHACMEAHSALARWDPATGTLHIWTPTQSPRNVAGELAHMLGLAPERVHLHRVGVGGDFGARVKAGDVEVLAAHLSMATARPVAIRLGRDEEFAFAKRQHETWVELASHFDADGRVRFREAEVTVDNGAFIQGGSNQMSYCTLLLASQYRLEGAEVRGRSVYTNRRPGGAFRGAGGPQAAFAIESQMDEIAAELGLDPIDLRLRNLTPEGGTTITGWQIASSGAAACLQEVRRRLDWDRSRAAGGAGRGVGVALAMHVSGAIVSPPTGRAGVAIEIGRNGGVVLSSGCADPGTGEYAVIAQLAAGELGIAPEAVALRVMDTAETPFDPGAGSSRATMVTGGAVLAGARAMAEALRLQAAAMLGVDPGAVRLEGGMAWAGGRSLPLGKIAAVHPDAAGGTLRIARETAVPVPAVPMTHADSGFGNLSPAYAFAAHGVEVEVDRDTGAVRVLRVVAVHDAGTVVNPAGAEGQVTGGVVMGLGMALSEQLLWQDGRPHVTGFVDYAMPRAADVPPIEVVFVGRPDPLGPAGAKSVSEVALMPTAAAVANAIAHATGIRLRDLPMTPDRVLAALPPRPGVRPAPMWRRPGRWWAAAVRRAYPRGLFALLHRLGPARPPEGPRLPVAAVLRPADAAAAGRALAVHEAAAPLGGGTDLLPLRARGLAAPRVLVALSGCADLREAAETAGGGLQLGAALTLAEAEARLRAWGRPADVTLAEAIDAIATPQLRQTATLGGNLCQANRCQFLRSGFDCYKRGGAARPCYALAGDHRYHHAVIGGGRCQSVTPSDLATALAGLGADILARGPGGTRRIPADAFYRGPGETVLRDGEIVAAIRLGAADRDAASAYGKFALTPDGFAVASACALLRLDGGGRVGSARIVLGGVAATPWRARAAEDELTGLRPGPGTVAAAAEAWTAAAHPLPLNGWKLAAAAGLLRGVLARALAAPEMPPAGIPRTPVRGRGHAPEPTAT